MFRIYAAAAFCVGIVFSFGTVAQQRPPQVTAAYIAELKQAADKGGPVAAMTLAEIYDRGAGADVPADPVQAMRYYKIAAEKPDALAMNKIANLYASGRGVARDQKLAAEWWEKSVELEDGPALYNLGVAYELGQGVPANTTKAAQLYLRAVKLQHIWPMYRLGRLYETGNGVPRSAVDAVRWLYDASMFDYEPATVRMGQLYTEGKLVRKDDEIAADYLTRAEKQKSKDVNAQTLHLSKPDLGPIRPAIGTDFGQGPKTVYRGKALVGSTYPGIDNDAFFKTMKLAIDLTMELPEVIRFRTAVLDMIIYDPPHAQRPKVAGQEMLGRLWTSGKPLEPMAQVINYNVASASFAPIDLGFLILEGGRYVADQRRLIEIHQIVEETRERKMPLSEARRAEFAKEYRYIQARLTGNDPEVNKGLDCERLAMRYDAYRFWKLEEQKQQQIRQQSMDMDCGAWTRSTGR